jgi:hypothetical protein
MQDERMSVCVCVCVCYHLGGIAETPYTHHPLQLFQNSGCLAFHGTSAAAHFVVHIRVALGIMTMSVLGVATPSWLWHGPAHPST